MHQFKMQGLIHAVSFPSCTNIIMEVSREIASSVGSLLDGLHTKLASEIAAGSLLLPSRPRPIRGLSPASPSAPLFKSQFSALDQREVRRLKEEMAQFEEGLVARSRAVEEEERRVREEAARAKERRVRAQSERHREAALVRKQQRWLQRREQQLLAGNASRHSPSTSLLYQEAEERQVRQEEVQERERSELLSVLSQQRRGLVNISRLNDHEQSYLRRVRQQKAERMRRMEEARATAKTLEEAEAVTLKSKFYQRVAALENQQREAAENAKRQKLRSRERLREFVQRVRSESELLTQNHHRPLHATTRAQQSSPTRTQLTPGELREEGDRFLRESLLHVSKHPKRSIATEVSQPPHRTDYLQELRRQRTTTGSERSFLVEEGRIERILLSQLPRQEKVERLKRMAFRLEAGPPSADAQKELEKIHTKMKILQAALLARE